MGQEVISLICCKEDVEIDARKSFVTVWIVKHENRFLREVVVLPLQEVFRADEMESHQILTSFARILTCSGREYSPIPLGLPENQASPLSSC